MRSGYCRVITPPGDAYKYVEMRSYIDSVLNMNGYEVVFKTQENPIFKRLYTRFDLGTDETGGRYWYRHTSVEYSSGEETDIDTPTFGVTNLACLYEYVKAEMNCLTKDEDLWFIRGIVKEYDIVHDVLEFDVKRLISDLMYRNGKGATITFDKDKSDFYDFRSVDCTVGECTTNFKTDDGCIYEDYSNFDDVVYTVDDKNEKISIYDEESNYATLIALLRRIVDHIYKYGYAINGETTVASTDDIEKVEIDE